MVVESNQFDQIGVIIFVVFEVFSDYFSESINYEFLFKFRVEFLGITELFVRFVFVFESLEVEEGKR